MISDKLLKELKAKIAKNYQETTAYIQPELSGFFDVEKQALTELYNEAVGYDFFNQVPEYARKATERATIVAGMPVGDWFERQSADLAFKFESTIRQGLLDGKQTPELAKETAELFAIFRRWADTLVITAVAKVADDAHKALRDENLDLIKGEKHLSTLDTRTSTVCQVRDGKMWDTEYKPIGHDLPYQRPPLHPRCRSILQLVLKDWKALGFDGVEEMPTSTRASQDGQVSENITYEEWLKSKTPEQQDKALGKGKADLWRRGVITFADMLDQRGRPLTLQQLQDWKKIPQTVRAIRRKTWEEAFKERAEKLYYTFEKVGIIIDHHGIARFGERLAKLNLTVDDAIQFIKNTKATHIDNRNGRLVQYDSKRKIAVISSNTDGQIITIEKAITPSKHWKVKDE